MVIINYLKSTQYEVAIEDGVIIPETKEDVYLITTNMDWVREFNLKNPTLSVQVYQRLEDAPMDIQEDIANYPDATPYHAVVYYRDNKLVSISNLEDVINSCE